MKRSVLMLTILSAGCAPRMIVFKEGKGTTAVLRGATEEQVARVLGVVRSRLSEIQPSAIVERAARENGIPAGTWEIRREDRTATQVKPPLSSGAVLSYRSDWEFALPGRPELPEGIRFHLRMSLDIVAWPKEGATPHPDHVLPQASVHGVYVYSEGASAFVQRVADDAVAEVEKLVKSVAETEGIAVDVRR